jgi:Fe-S oxidoreductase
MLRKLGLDLVHPDSGCCGMAGAFGFEARHYDLSMKLGERVILPMVREADAETLIIADGFSCREQIEQGTGRKTLHFAEVVKMAFE